MKMWGMHIKNPGMGWRPCTANCSNCMSADCIAAFAGPIVC